MMSYVQIPIMIIMKKMIRLLHFSSSIFSSLRTHARIENAVHRVRCHNSLESFHVVNIKIVVTNKPWQQNLIVVPVHEMSVDNSGQ